jgi:hypothetical protein
MIIPDRKVGDMRAAQRRSQQRRIRRLITEIRRLMPEGEKFVVLMRDVRGNWMIQRDRPYDMFPWNRWQHDRLLGIVVELVPLLEAAEVESDGEPARLARLKDLYGVGYDSLGALIIFAAPPE